MKRALINEQLIVQEYLDGKSVTQIFKEYKTNPKRIFKVLTDNNIIIRTSRQQHLKKNKVLEDFFENIDTEEKAYLLGLWFADGNIAVTRGKIKGKYYSRSVVQISLTDRELIDKIVKILKYTNKITVETHKMGKDCYRISVRSQKMFDDLSNKGCVVNKSLILKFPNVLPHLQHHFIRGYFDGDGSVFETKSKYKTKSGDKYILGLNTSFCGTLEFLTELKNILGFGNIYKESRRTSNTWELRSCKSDSVKLYKYMYNNASVFLERKKNKFEQCKDLQRL